MIFRRKKQKTAHVPAGVVGQDSSQSIVKDGRYDPDQLSPHEEAVIRSVLKNAWSGKYPERFQGLGLANESYSILYKPRYILHEIIVQKYAGSDNPFDMLAVAAAYRTKGASGRGEAIRYYEKWLDSSTKKQREEAAKYLFDAREPFLSLQMAKLYNDENRLDEALKYATAAEKMNTGHAPGFPLLLADIYKKQDIGQCVRYLREVCASKEYRAYPDFAKKLSDAEALQEKGYQYKPRKSRQSEQSAKFEASVREAARRFMEKEGV